MVADQPRRLLVVLEGSRSLVVVAAVVAELSAHMVLLPCGRKTPSGDGAGGEEFRRRCSRSGAGRRRRGCGGRGGVVVAPGGRGGEAAGGGGGHAGRGGA